MQNFIIVMKKVTFSNEDDHDRMKVQKLPNQAFLKTYIKGSW
jgi:hypothetical protein